MLLGILKNKYSLFPIRIVGVEPIHQHVFSDPVPTLKVKDDDLKVKDPKGLHCKQ